MGPFSQIPDNHLRGAGCPQCAHRQRRITQETFEARAWAVHGDAYDWSGVVYARMHAPVTVVCRRHGPFAVTPMAFLKGQGCPEDSGSYFVRVIHSVLRESGLQFTREWRHDSLRSESGRELRFDFAIPALKLLIEYDGRHHREPTVYGNMSQEDAVRVHERTVYHDAMKERWAADNEYILLRLGNNCEDKRQVESVLLKMIKILSSPNSDPSD